MSESAERPPGRPWWAWVFMLWTLFPLVTAIADHPSPAHLALAIGGFVAFDAAWLARIAGGPRHAGSWALVIYGAVLATVMVVFERPDWSLLYAYVAGAAAFTLPENRTFLALWGAVVLTLGANVAAGSSGDEVANWTLQVFASGLAAVGFVTIIRKNRQLIDANAEIHRLAVNEERLRFARDLHDLLGHNLSVISLKAQLARRVLDSDPETARREIADVESVTRTALAEVREAVAGYRQPTLATELAGARTALDAAGISCTVVHPEVALAPSREAVLAWGVREATTNVIRHSGASACTIRIAVEDGEARLVVTDDGPSASGEQEAGSGLRGLAERAARAGGRLVAAPRPAGGFGVQLSVPLG